MCRYTEPDGFFYCSKMAEGKKSFILYVDQRGTFNKLSDEQAGKLIKHIFAYVSDEQPEADFITELAFEGIKTTLKRDLKKYENYIEKQRENGSKGGRPPKPKKPKPFFQNPSEPKKADSVNDSVSDSDSVNDNISDSKSFFDNQKLNDVFCRWLKMLHERGKPMTQSSIEQLQMKMNYQQDDISIKQIEQSLENGWLTLRPIEATQHAKPERQKRIPL